MESIPGTIEVNNRYVQFIPDSDQEKKEVLTLLSNINIFPVFKWDIKQLREVHFRRYNLRKTSLEFFLLDQTNYLLNFEKKIMTRVYQAILSLKPPRIRYADIRSCLFVCLFVVYLIRYCLTPQVSKQTACHLWPHGQMGAPGDL